MGVPPLRRHQFGEMDMSQVRLESDVTRLARWWRECPDCGLPLEVEP